MPTQPDNVLSFASLQPEHFPLLLTWLEAPHVKNWWDQNLTYTTELVAEKFEDRTHDGSVIETDTEKVYGFIIVLNDLPIGYIQVYNAEKLPSLIKEGDFPRIERPIAGCDLFIGEREYLGKGAGTLAVRMFWKYIIAPHYEACFVDPETTHGTAIKMYERAGFRQCGKSSDKKFTKLIITRASLAS